MDPLGKHLHIRLIRDDLDAAHAVLREKIGVVAHEVPAG